MQASQASRRARQTGARAFIARHTRLRPVPGLDEIRLHLADEALPLWGAVAAETADPDTALPYWAFAWGGGLAIAHYLRDHPEIVAGRRVFDLGSGSGLCAIAAMQAGATSATAADIDPFAIAAIERNARANKCRLAHVHGDALEGLPPDVDIVLAGDCWYDAGLADRVTPWLRRARASGIDVIVGDPGRRFFPATEFDDIGAYDVRTTTDLEDLALSRAWVYRLR
jgi:predicted nicotinamide N-methyase